MNVVPFRNKNLEREKEFKIQTEKNRLKDVVDMLIDASNGDFCIIFKTDDIRDIFENDLTTKFIVGTNNTDKMKVSNYDYFFNDFGSNIDYFKL